MIPEKRSGDKPVHTYLSDEPREELPRPAPEKRPLEQLFSVAGRVCVVTGAKHGIGHGVCQMYAESGATVVFVDYLNSDAEAAQMKKDTGNEQIYAYTCDVGNYDAVTSTVEAIYAKFGAIDVFVANAGIAWKAGPISENDMDNTEWKKLMDVNLNGVYYCAKIVGKIFKAQFAKTHRKGSFIMTASMSASIANFPQCLTPYNMSKAAVKHFAKSLGLEWAEFARVNSVSPGYCDTGINDHLPREFRGKMWSMVPMGREALPFEIATAYLYLASDAASYVTGSDFVVDGGYTIV